MGILDDFSAWRTKQRDKVSSWHLGRKFLYLLGILLVVGLLFGWAAVSCNYSDGVRAGVVRKISNKGLVMKTWEGELQLGGLVSVNDPNQMAQGGNVWYFSVDDSEEKAIKDLERAAATGNRVSLRYKEKWYKFSWRGETKYFVYQVEEVR